MSEQYFIDPPEEIAGRSELEITPWMTPDGAEWPASTNAPFYADGDIGQVVLDELWNNREVPIPLRLRDRGGTAFATARSLFQGKVGEIQGGRGGVLKRVGSAGTVYADIISARIRLSGGWAQARDLYDTDAVLELVLGPEDYGGWVELDAMSGSGEVVGVLQQDGADAAIEGNFPPGNRCRIVVTDNSGNDQRGLIYAFRARNYDSAATAALSYEAEALTPLDTARGTALAGASGGTVIRHPGLATSWTPVLSTVLAAGTAYPTSQGTYRALARVHSTDGTAVALRLVYDVGDLVLPEENARWTFPDASRFYVADLGMVRAFPQPGASSYRWLGQIQAKGAAGGETVSIDKVWLVPADETMGVLRASTASAALVRGLAGFVTRDEVTQTSGALAGKTLSGGGSWTTVGGDAVDFTIDTTYRAVLRNTVEDSGTSPTLGRLAIASPTARMADQAAQCDVRFTGSDQYLFGGLVFRYVDIRNYAQFVLTADPNYPVAYVSLRAVVAGVATFLLLSGGRSAALTPVFARSAVSQIVTPSPLAAYVRLIGTVFADGSYSMAVGVDDAITDRFTGHADVLATAGALARGSAGLCDTHFDSNPINRYYDNFQCWVPPKDAVVFANQSVEASTTGFLREDQTGTSLGPVSDPIGNLPRLPNSGQTGQPVEVLAKWSRGDLNTLPDAALDAGQAQVFYRPCYLANPG